MHEQLHLPAVCQRWLNGRARYRPARELFDPTWASVEPITEQVAKAFIQCHHYSHAYPAARFRAGLFIKAPFRKEELCGVGVFSVPMNQQVVPAHLGVEAAAGVELGRFCLVDHVAANAESWTLARMKRLLRTALPEVRGVVAYCDPLERRTADGTLVKPGHIGTIYKAIGCEYRGRSSARTLWLAPNGESVSDRLLSKIRLDEVGHAYAMDKLHALGAPRRLLQESGRAFVERLKGCGWLRPLRHPGNHTFTFRL